jgi:hypothetical protein
MSRPRFDEHSGAAVVADGRNRNCSAAAEQQARMSGWPNATNNSKFALTSRCRRRATGSRARSAYTDSSQCTREARPAREGKRGRDEARRRRKRRRPTFCDRYRRQTQFAPARRAQSTCPGSCQRATPTRATKRADPGSRAKRLPCTLRTKEGLRRKSHHRRP